MPIPNTEQRTTRSFENESTGKVFQDRSSEQRTTLSFKTKSAGPMFQTASKAEVEQKNLNEVIQRIFKEYADTPVNNYTEEFRRSSTAVRKLTDALASSLVNLEESLKYPKMCKDVFEQLTKNVQNNLSGVAAQKFSEALNIFFNTKKQLPKVVDGADADKSKTLPEDVRASRLTTLQRGR